MLEKNDILKSIDPATEETISIYSSYSSQKVEEIVTRSFECFKSRWSRFSVQDRLGLIRNLKKELISHRNNIANLITREMGKPIKQSQGEIDKCVWLLEYYLEKTRDHLVGRSQQIGMDNSEESRVSFQPLGPILLIMPWNFPFWQVFRAAIPAICAGNTIIQKHALNTLGCSEAIENLFKAANFPDGVFQNVIVSNDRVESIIGNEKISGISLTGSIAAGRRVAELAGRSLKKTVLELGGSDPYLICEDADIEKAVEACVQSRLINSGQSCIAAKRFIVTEHVYTEFLDRTIASFEQKKLGNPLEEDCDVGPLARNDLRDKLNAQVGLSVQKGARLAFSSQKKFERGFYSDLQVLTDVIPGCPAFDDELFGPVAAIVKAKNTQEGISLANQSRFGLGAAVFSEDLESAERIAREELMAGNCAINGFVKSDPRLPFGGINDSGYGRELGREGLLEFCNIKVCTGKFIQ